MSVGAITRMNVVAVRETLPVGKYDRSCIGILLMASKYRHEAKLKLAPEFRPTLPVDFAIPFVYGVLLRLCQQRQLFRRYRLNSAPGASRVGRRFLEEALDKRESHMPGVSRMYERCICSPVETCDGPGNKARLKREELVD